MTGALAGFPFFFQTLDTDCLNGQLYRQLFEPGTGIFFEYWYGPTLCDAKFRHHWISPGLLLPGDNIRITPTRDGSSLVCLWLEVVQCLASLAGR